MATVLLVDDQRLIGLALSQLFTSEPDIEFHHCVDANAAVETANRIRPDVILQDLVMPGIDGLTLVGHYRNNQTTASTPVVVLSANDDAESRARALAAGANDFLRKVPAKSDLLACVRAHAPRRVVPSEVTFDPSAMPDLPEEVTQMLIEQFVAEAEGRVADLKAAAGRNDRDALRSAAHALKGSAFVIGAKQLGALSAALEKGTSGLNAIEQVAGIERELESVRAVFAAERQKTSTPGAARS